MIRFFSLHHHPPHPTTPRPARPILAFSDFHIPLMSGWTLRDYGGFFYLSKACSNSGAHCGAETQNTLALIVIAPLFQRQISYSVILISLKQYLW